ncbi:MAG: 30S ribosomal protein S18 [Candidatus Aminicenantes bacterium]|nr:30S ribosomal protein S18 [Candidatus Aminicenantes bacterium]
MINNNSSTGSGPGKSQKKFYFSRRKYCVFCRDRIKLIDYKNYKTLENFTLETGKILPGRVSGACNYHQKQLSKAIKRARHMAFLKYIEPKRG